MSYPQYTGYSLQEWINCYSFSNELVKCLADIGVNFLIELNEVYNDSELMSMIQQRVKKLEFVRFQRVREHTTVLLENKTEERISNKLSSSGISLLARYPFDIS